MFDRRTPAKRMIVVALVLSAAMTAPWPCPGLSTDLYQVTSGSYHVRGGIGGWSTFPLPSGAMLFIELLTDVMSNTAELRIFDANWRPFPTHEFGYVLTSGAILDNEIIFHEIVQRDFPLMDEGELNYRVVLGEDSLEMHGTVVFPQRCCDIEYYFGRSYNATFVHRLGDGNGDRTVNLSDLPYLETCFIGPDTQAMPDCDFSDWNHDSYVDLLDVAALQSAFE